MLKTPRTTEEVDALYVGTGRKSAASGASASTNDGVDDDEAYPHLSLFDLGGLSNAPSAASMFPITRQSYHVAFERVFATVRNESLDAPMSYYSVVDNSSSSSSSAAATVAAQRLGLSSSPLLGGAFGQGLNTLAGSYFENPNSERVGVRFSASTSSSALCSPSLTNGHSLLRRFGRRPFTNKEYLTMDAALASSSASSPQFYQGDEYASSSVIPSQSLLRSLQREEDEGLLDYNDYESNSLPFTGQLPSLIANPAGSGPAAGYSSLVSAVPLSVAPTSFASDAIPSYPLVTHNSPAEMILYESSARGGLYCALQFRNIWRLLRKNQRDSVFRPTRQFASPATMFSREVPSSTSEYDKMVNFYVDQAYVEMGVCMPRIATRWRFLTETFFPVSSTEAFYNDSVAAASSSGPSSSQQQSSSAFSSFYLYSSSSSTNTLSPFAATLLYDPTRGLLDPLECPIGGFEGSGRSASMKSGTSTTVFGRYVATLPATVAINGTNTTTAGSSTTMGSNSSSATSFSVLLNSSAPFVLTSFSSYFTKSIAAFSSSQEEFGATRRLKKTAAQRLALLTMAPSSSVSSTAPVNTDPSAFEHLRHLLSEDDYEEDSPLFTAAIIAVDRLNKTLARAFPLAVGWHLGQYLTSNVLLKEPMVILNSSSSLTYRSVKTTSATLSSYTAARDMLRSLFTNASSPSAAIPSEWSNLTARSTSRHNLFEWIRQTANASSSTSSSAFHTPLFSLVDASNILLDAAQCTIMTIVTSIMAIEDAPLLQQGSLLLDYDNSTNITVAMQKNWKNFTFNVVLPNASNYPRIFESLDAERFRREQQNNLTSSSFGGFFRNYTFYYGAGRYANSTTLNYLNRFRIQKDALFEMLSNSELIPAMKRMDLIIGRAVECVRQVMVGLKGAEEVLSALLLDMANGTSSSSSSSSSFSSSSSLSVSEKAIQLFESLFTAPSVATAALAGGGAADGSASSPSFAPSSGSTIPPISNVARIRRIAGKGYFDASKVNFTQLLINRYGNGTTGSAGVGLPPLLLDNFTLSAIQRISVEELLSRLTNGSSKALPKAFGFTSPQYAFSPSASASASPPLLHIPTPFEVASHIGTLRASQRSLYCVRAFFLSLRNMSAVDGDKYLKTWAQRRADGGREGSVRGGGGYAQSRNHRDNLRSSGALYTGSIKDCFESGQLGGFDVMDDRMYPTATASSSSSSSSSSPVVGDDRLPNAEEVALMEFPPNVAVSSYAAAAAGTTANANSIVAVNGRELTRGALPSGRFLTNDGDFGLRSASLNGSAVRYPDQRELLLRGGSTDSFVASAAVSDALLATRRRMIHYLYTYRTQHQVFLSLGQRQLTRGGLGRIQNLSRDVAAAAAAASSSSTWMDKEELMIDYLVGPSANSSSSISSSSGFNNSVSSLNELFAVDNAFVGGSGVARNYYQSAASGVGAGESLKLSPTTMAASLSAFTAPIGWRIPSSSSSNFPASSPSATALLLPPTVNARNSDFQQSIALQGMLPLVVLPLYYYPTTTVNKSSFFSPMAAEANGTFFGRFSDNEQSTNAAFYEGGAVPIVPLPLGTVEAPRGPLAPPRHRGTINSVGVPLPMLRDPSDGTRSSSGGSTVNPIPTRFTTQPTVARTTTTTTEATTTTHPYWYYTTLPTTSPPPTSAPPPGPTTAAAPYYGATIIQPESAGGSNGLSTVCTDGGFRRTVDPITGRFNCVHCNSSFGSFGYCAAKEDSLRLCDNKPLSAADTVDELVRIRGFTLSTVPFVQALVGLPRTYPLTQLTAAQATVIKNALFEELLGRDLYAYDEASLEQQFDYVVGNVDDPDAPMMDSLPATAMAAYYPMGWGWAGASCPFLCRDPRFVRVTVGNLTAANSSSSSASSSNSSLQQQQHDRLMARFKTPRCDHNTITSYSYQMTTPTAAYTGYTLPNGATTTTSTTAAPAGSGTVVNKDILEAFAASISTAVPMCSAAPFGVGYDVCEEAPIGYYPSSAATVDRCSFEGDGHGMNTAAEEGLYQQMSSLGGGVGVPTETLDSMLYASAYAAAYWGEADPMVNLQTYFGKMAPTMSSSSGSLPSSSTVSSTSSLFATVISPYLDPATSAKLMSFLEQKGGFSRLPGDDSSGVGDDGNTEPAADAFYITGGISPILTQQYAYDVLSAGYSAAFTTVAAGPRSCGFMRHRRASYPIHKLFSDGDRGAMGGYGRQSIGARIGLDVISDIGDSASGFPPLSLLLSSTNLTERERLLKTAKDWLRNSSNVLRSSSVISIPPLFVLQGNTTNRTLQFNATQWLLSLNNSQLFEALLSEEGLANISFAGEVRDEEVVALQKKNTKLGGSNSGSLVNAVIDSDEDTLLETLLLAGARPFVLDDDDSIDATFASSVPRHLHKKLNRNGITARFNVSNVDLLQIAEGLLNATTILDKASRGRRRALTMPKGGGNTTNATTNTSALIGGVLRNTTHPAEWWWLGQGGTVPSFNKPLYISSETVLDFDTLLPTMADFAAVVDDIESARVTVEIGSAYISGGGRSTSSSSSYASSSDVPIWSYSMSFFMNEHGVMGQLWLSVLNDTAFEGLSAASSSSPPITPTTSYSDYLSAPFMLLPNTMFLNQTAYISYDHPAMCKGTAPKAPYLAFDMAAWDPVTPLWRKQFRKNGTTTAPTATSSSSFSSRGVNATLLMLLDMLVLDARDKKRSAREWSGPTTPIGGGDVSYASSSYSGLDAVGASSSRNVFLRDEMGVRVGEWAADDTEVYECPCGDEELEEWWWAAEGYVGQKNRTCSRTRHNLHSKYLTKIPLLQTLEHLNPMGMMQNGGVSTHNYDEVIVADDSSSVSSSSSVMSLNGHQRSLIKDFGCGFTIDFNEALVYFEVNGRILPDSCMVGSRVEYTTNITNTVNTSYLYPPTTTTAVTTATAVTSPPSSSSAGFITAVVNTLNNITMTRSVTAPRSVPFTDPFGTNNLSTALTMDVFSTASASSLMASAPPPFYLMLSDLLRPYVSEPSALYSGMPEEGLESTSATASGGGVGLRSGLCGVWRARLVAQGLITNDTVGMPRFVLGSNNATAAAVDVLNSQQQQSLRNTSILNSLSIPSDLIQMAGQRFTVPKPFFDGVKSSSSTTSFSSLPLGGTILGIRSAVNTLASSSSSTVSTPELSTEASQRQAAFLNLRNLTRRLRISVGGWNGHARAGAISSASSMTAINNRSDPSSILTNGANIARAPHLKLGLGGDALTNAANQEAFKRSFGNGTSFTVASSSASSPAFTSAWGPTPLPVMQSRTTAEYFAAVTSSIFVAAASVSYVSFFPQTTAAVREYQQREMSWRAMLNKATEEEPDVTATALRTLITVASSSSSSDSSATTTVQQQKGLSALRTAGIVMEQHSYSPTTASNPRIVANRTAPATALMTLLSSASSSVSSNAVFGVPLRVAYSLLTATTDITAYRRPILASNGFAERIAVNKRVGFAVTQLNKPYAVDPFFSSSSSSSSSSASTTVSSAASTENMNRMEGKVYVNFSASVITMPVALSRPSIRGVFLQLLNKTMLSSAAAAMHRQNVYVPAIGVGAQMRGGIEVQRRRRGSGGFVSASSPSSSSSSASSSTVTFPFVTAITSPATDHSATWLLEPMQCLQGFFGSLLCGKGCPDGALTSSGRMNTSFLSSVELTAAGGAASSSASSSEGTPLTACGCISTRTMVEEEVEESSSDASTPPIVYGYSCQWTAPNYGVPITETAAFGRNSDSHASTAPTFSSIKEVLALPIVPPSFRLRVPMGSVPLYNNSHGEDDGALVTTVGGNGSSTALFAAKGRISARLFCGAGIPVGVESSLALASSIAQQLTTATSAPSATVPKTSLSTTVALTLTPTSTTITTTTPAPTAVASPFEVLVASGGNGGSSSSSSATSTSSSSLFGSIPSSSPYTGVITGASTAVLTQHDDANVGGEWAHDSYSSLAWGSKIGGGATTLAAMTAFSTATTLANTSTNSSSLSGGDDGIVGTVCRVLTALTAAYFDLTTQPASSSSNTTTTNTSSSSSSRLFSVGAPSAHPEVLVQPQPIASFYGEWCAIGARVTDPPLRVGGPLTYTKAFLSLVRANTPDHSSGSMQLSMRNFTILRNLQGGLPIRWKTSGSGGGSTSATSAAPVATSPYTWFPVTTAPPTVAPPTTTGITQPTTTDPLIYVPTTTPLTTTPPPTTTGLTTRPPTTIATLPVPTDAYSELTTSSPLGYGDLTYYYRMSGYQLAETFTLSTDARHTEAVKSIQRLSKAMRDVRVQVIVVASYLYPKGDPVTFSRIYNKSSSDGLSSVSDPFRLHDRADPNGDDVEFISEEIIDPSSLPSRSSGVAGQLGRGLGMAETADALMKRAKEIYQKAATVLNTSAASTKRTGTSDSSRSDVTNTTLTASGVAASFVDSASIDNATTNQPMLSLNYGDQNFYYSGNFTSHFIDTDAIDVASGELSSSSSTSTPTSTSSSSASPSSSSTPFSSQSLVIALKIPRRLLSETLNDSSDPLAADEGTNTNRADGSRVAGGTPSRPLWVFTRVIPSVLREAETANDLQLAKNSLADEGLFTSSAFTPSSWSAVTLLPFSTLPPMVRQMVEELDPDLGVTSAASDLLSAAYLGDAATPMTSLSSADAAMIRNRVYSSVVTNAAGTSRREFSSQAAKTSSSLLVSPSAATRNPFAVAALNNALRDALTRVVPLPPLNPKTDDVGFYIAVALFGACGVLAPLSLFTLIFMLTRQGRLPCFGYLFCERYLNPIDDEEESDGDAEGGGDRAMNDGRSGAGPAADGSANHHIMGTDDGIGLMVEIMTPFGPQHVFIPRSALQQQPQQQQQQLPSGDAASCNSFGLSHQHGGTSGSVYGNFNTPMMATHHSQHHGSTRMMGINSSPHPPHLNHFAHDHYHHNSPNGQRVALGEAAVPTTATSVQPPTTKKRRPSTVQAADDDGGVQSAKKSSKKGLRRKSSTAVAEDPPQQQQLADYPLQQYYPTQHPKESLLSSNDGLGSPIQPTRKSTTATLDADGDDDESCVVIVDKATGKAVPLNAIDAKFVAKSSPKPASVKKKRREAETAAAAVTEQLGMQHHPLQQRRQQEELSKRGHEEELARLQQMMRMAAGGNNGPSREPISFAEEEKEEGRNQHATPNATSNRGSGASSVGKQPKKEKSRKKSRPSIVHDEDG